MLPVPVSLVDPEYAYFSALRGRAPAIHEEPFLTVPLTRAPDSGPLIPEAELFVKPTAPLLTRLKSRPVHHLEAWDFLIMFDVVGHHGIIQGQRRAANQQIKIINHCSR